MQGKVTRLGVIYPVGGGEQDYYRFAEATGGAVRIFLVTTRLYGEDKDHDVTSLLKSGDINALGIAGGKLQELNPDAAIWACTSASFVGGYDWSLEQASAIGRAAGCPAGTTSLAFVNALDTLNLDRVAIMASYPESVSTRFKAFLERRAKYTVNIQCLDVLSGWDAALIPAAQIKEAACAVDHPDAEAILIPDTALPTFHLITELEDRLGKPVLTANSVSLWELLRLAGIHERRAELGRLFMA